MAAMRTLEVWMPSEPLIPT